MKTIFIYWTVQYFGFSFILLFHKRYLPFLYKQSSVNTSALFQMSSWKMMVTNFDAVLRFQTSSSICCTGTGFSINSFHSQLDNHGDWTTYRPRCLDSFAWVTTSSLLHERHRGFYTSICLQHGWCSFSRRPLEERPHAWASCLECHFLCWVPEKDDYICLWWLQRYIQTSGILYWYYSANIVPFHS